MELELSHRQGLTLAMQTSMRLLQLNNLQLRNYLGELMTTNAVVELEFPEIEYRPSPFDRRGSSTAPSGNTAVSKEQLMEDKAAGISVLHDLFLQSAALKLPQPLQRIMQYLIHSLDTNGFLTESAEATAAMLGVSQVDVQKCIALLQGMEPAGVGAADLKECLRLQLIRQPPADHPRCVSLRAICLNWPSSNTAILHALCRSPRPRSCAHVNASVRSIPSRSMGSKAAIP